MVKTVPFQQLRPSQASLAETMPPEPQGYPKMGRAHVLRSLFDSCLVGQAAIAICVHGPVEGLHLLGRWRRTGAGAQYKSSFEVPVESGKHQL